MALAVENASIVIPMISSEYQNSENCEKELSYADTLKKNVIPVLLEPNFRPSGWLALVIARFKYVDIRSDDEIAHCLIATSSEQLTVSFSMKTSLYYHHRKVKLA